MLNGPRGTALCFLFHSMHRSNPGWRWCSHKLLWFYGTGCCTLFETQGSGAAIGKKGSNKIMGAGNQTIIIGTLCAGC